MLPLVKLKVFGLLMLCAAVLMPLFVAKAQASPTTWAIQAVDTVGSVGEWSSLALDSNNYPHISYLDFAWHRLKYAKWTGTDWYTDTIDAYATIDGYSSLALDSNEYPHISYYDASNGDLKYATWTGSQWSTEAVDSVEDVGEWCSLALDSNDHPHISYYDVTNGHFKYAEARYIESCDANGAQKDYFDITETFYMKGSGYSPLTTYDVYIVNDTTWVDGMTIPARVLGTVLTITTAGSEIPPISVWFPPLLRGKYDIIVDVNNNGKYDAAIDVLDDNDVEVTAGFAVVPEFPSLIILLLFMIMTLFVAIAYKRTHQQLSKFI
jgi:hypothetical protein